MDWIDHSQTGCELSTMSHIAHEEAVVVHWERKSTYLFDVNRRLDLRHVRVNVPRQGRDVDGLANLARHVVRFLFFARLYLQVQRRNVECSVSSLQGSSLMFVRLSRGSLQRGERRWELGSALLPRLLCGVLGQRKPKKTGALHTHGPSPRPP